MTFVQAVKTVLANYAKFDGRSGREEFWWWFLAYIIGYAVIIVIGGAMGAKPILIFVYLAAVVVPSVAVGIRRFHDIGKPALWAILLFIPLVNLIIMLIFLTKPSDGANQYGSGPQAPTA